jgi:tetratricopeptide (TPR) repeat protein
LKLFRSSDLSFYRWSLRKDGGFTIAGLIFAAFAAAWIGVVLHSGFIRYHERLGARAFESLQIPDELALAKSDPGEFLSVADRENIEAGRRHFAVAARYAAFTNVQAIPKWAWLEYLGGDADSAIRHLERAAALQSGEAKAVAHYYRGSILNRLGRYEEAIAELDEAIRERPELVLAREEEGFALWQLNRRNDAVNAWAEALRQNPRLPVAASYLAGAAALAGRSDAAGYEKQAAQLIPLDPRFHWMLALRLETLGMDELGAKHRDIAIKLDPRLRAKLRPSS